jgi:hypothetical protein
MKKGQKKIDLLKYFFPIIIIISSFFLYFNFQFLIQNPLIFVLIPIWTISLSFAYSKKRKIIKERIFTWLILITFLVIYFNFYASPFIIFAATPTPSPPSVSHSPEPQKGGGTITFSSNAQPGAAGELVKLIICKNNTAGCVLNSQWGYRRAITISNSGSSALTDYQVLVTNPIYNETGLVLSLHFNEGSGTIAYDSSGNNNNGNLVNGPSWVDGKFGKALSFNGVNQKVSIPETPSLRFGSGNFAITVWMKSNVSQRQWMVSHYAGSNPGWGCGVADTSGKADFFTRSSAGTTEVISSRVVTDGQWHFVVCQRVGNEFRIYIDGVLDASQTFAHTSVDNTASLAIGEEANYNRQWFNGIIDEVRIYKRALIDAEIQALYQAKARLDYGDIRFTDSDGSTLLNYWQEADGRFWVKVPSIPASSTKTIYVYYGNPSATSVSNGRATFVLFDDFQTLSQWSKSNANVVIDSTFGNPAPSVKFSTSGNGVERIRNLTNAGSSFVIELNAYLTLGSATRAIVDTLWYLQDKTNGLYGYFARLDTSGAFEKNGILKWTTTGWTGICNGASATSPGSWHRQKIIVQGNTFYHYYDDTLMCSVTDTTFAPTSGFLVMTEMSGSVEWVDNYRVRKFTSPEPTTSIGTEEVPPPSNFIYTQSSAVSSNPSATYTCPSCQYSNNTYYGVAYSVNESVWTAFTTAKAFVCKMEVSPAGSCSCSSNTQCYNPCNINWGTYYDGYCYNNKCYDAIPGSAFGLAQSCLAGTILNHETSSQRYANVNGRLYYCKGNDNSVSPYPFVFSISPGSLAGNCKCLSDGSWACPPGIIPIRGGRIKIV